MLDPCCTHIRIREKHELILQGDKELMIEADEARIDQVVVNFVNNAVKYAPDQREIYLIVEDLGDRARISVKDSGPGIPADKIPHLFDRYYRADYSGVQYSGLGLGLYISAEIIRKHRGEIGVDSELGKGSTFWFTLPRHKNLS
jgi:signal transduction histidine kinase